MGQKPHIKERDEVMQMYLQLWPNLLDNTVNNVFRLFRRGD